MVVQMIILAGLSNEHSVHLLFQQDSSPEKGRERDNNPGWKCPEGMLRACDTDAYQASVVVHVRTKSAHYILYKLCYHASQHS